MGTKEPKTDDVTGTLVQVFDYEYQDLKAERDAAVADLERFVELHNQAQHERNEALDEAKKAQRLAVQLAQVVFWYEECCFAPDVHKEHDCPDLPDYYDETIEAWRAANDMPKTPWEAQ